MIFNRFFTPAHNSKDPSKRLAAIDKLSPENPNERRVLHELAFNDDNPDVSLAALAKIDSFALWQKMSQIAANERVKRHASNVVERALFENGHELSTQEKHAFLIESANVETLVKALNQDDTLLTETQLVIKLLEKVGRQNVTQTFFLNRASDEVQRIIVSNSQDTDLLQKLQRKAKRNETKQLIQARLDTLIAIKNKPIVLEKECRLVLAKLQAQLDKTDFELVVDTSQALADEFVQYQTQFDCLETQTVEALNLKYSSLSDKLTSHKQRLETEYKKAQAAKAKVLCDQQLDLAIENARAGVGALISDAMNDVTMGQIEAAQQHIQEAETLITQAKSFNLKRRYEQIEAELNQHQLVIDDFPNIQRKGAAVTAFLTTLEQRQSAVEAGSGSVNNADWLTEMKGEWAALIDGFHQIPEAWTQRWLAFNQFVANEKKRMDKRRDEKLSVCRRHISVVTNLISQGKFRPAMSRFTKLASDFEALEDDLKSAIEKRFDDVKQEVERLQGWQSYIAAPRKPALLEEVNRLVKEKVSNVSQRTKTIKYLRTQWQSLGNDGSEDAKQLDETFDALLEQAFAPCREHYAAQEALREQAKTQRESLIQTLSSLDADLEEATLHKEVEKLKQQWHEAGHVNAEDYVKLKQAWDEAVAQYNDKLFAWYQTNRQRKLALIEKVSHLLSEELSDSASDLAQAAQKQWKDVGFAGRRHETKLWREFRSANDKVFAAIKSLRQQRKSDLGEKHSALSSTLEALVENFDNLTESEQKQQLDTLAEAFKALPRKQVSKQKATMDELYQRIQDAKNAAKQQARQRSIDALIRVVERLESGDLEEAKASDDWSQLKKSWQNALASSTVDTKNRLPTTIQLEVLLQVEPSDDDPALRQQVQLDMMTAKFEQGEQADADSLIDNWLSQGEINADAIALLPRLKAILHKHMLGK